MEFAEALVPFLTAAVSTFCLERAIAGNVKDECGVCAGLAFRKESATARQCGRRCGVCGGNNDCEGGCTDPAACNTIQTRLRRWLVQLDECGVCGSPGAVLECGATTRCPARAIVRRVGRVRCVRWLAFRREHAIAKTALKTSVEFAAATVRLAWRVVLTLCLQF